jgi:hypothetical protein
MSSRLSKSRSERMSPRRFALHGRSAGTAWAARPGRREATSSPKAVRTGTPRLFNKSGRFRVTTKAAKSSSPGCPWQDAPTVSSPVFGGRTRAPAPHPSPDPAHASKSSTSSDSGQFSRPPHGRLRSGNTFYLVPSRLSAFSQTRVPRLRRAGDRAGRVQGAGRHAGASGAFIRCRAWLFLERRHEGTR